MGLEDLCADQLAAVADCRLSGIQKLKEQLCRLESKAYRLNCDDMRVCQVSQCYVPAELQNPTDATTAVV